MGFGAPTDPAYTGFLEGLKQVVADPDGKASWRWHFKDAKWYSYDPATYVLDDSYRLPDTCPELALKQDFGQFPKTTWELNEFAVPDLFVRLRKAYSSLSPLHPQASLVWSPWGGGDWRAAFKRTGTPPPHSPGQGPGPLPQECLDRIAQTREQERRGYITHDQAERIVAAIVAECAPAAAS